MKFPYLSELHVQVKGDLAINRPSKAVLDLREGDGQDRVCQVPVNVMMIMASIKYVHMRRGSWKSV